MTTTKQTVSWCVLLIGVLGAVNGAAGEGNMLSVEKPIVEKLPAERSRVEISPADNPLAEKPPTIQLAILLDTSSSMSGLINQAKTQLWSIVNELATTRKDGKIPELNVALYEYGKSSIPAEEGYIRMILPLTTDLDKVSEELFALTTNGGDEYCGMVIKSAIESLVWSGRSDDLKIVFIAGNEPFTQGKVDYREACKAAIEKGVIVNTIHCGDYDGGVSTGWKDGAVLADGRYMNIDHNRVAVHIESPQDKEIARLGVKLNDTYVAFGSMGMAGKARQTAQDSNAMTAGFSVNVQRAVSKSSSQYSNAGWDLVDAVEDKSVKIEEVKDEDIPEEMRKMNQQERADYLQKKAETRKELQQQISQLNEKRKEYVAEQMRTRADKGEDTLEMVIITTIREQAQSRSFTFKTAGDSSQPTDGSGTSE